MSRRDVRDACNLRVVSCGVQGSPLVSVESLARRERCSLDILFVPVRLDSVVLRASVLVLDRTIARVASRPVASIVSPLVRRGSFDDPVPSVGDRAAREARPMVRTLWRAR